jgi:hypothetical protein
MSLNRKALKFFVQLPPIAMLLQVFDGPASHIPPLLVGQTEP